MKLAEASIGGPMPKQTKKSIAQARAAEFTQAVTDTVTQLGGHEVENYCKPCFQIDTLAGPLKITPYPDADIGGAPWIACRFLDVKKAKAHFNEPFSVRNRLNPYSGKWNWHYGKGCPEGAAFALIADFRFDLRRVTGREAEEEAFIRELPPVKKFGGAARSYEEMYDLKKPLVQMLKTNVAREGKRWVDEYMVHFPGGRNQPIYVNGTSCDEAFLKASATRKAAHVNLEG